MAQMYWSLGAMDWDYETLKPSKKKLMELGMMKEAEAFGRRRKVPLAPPNNGRTGILFLTPSRINPVRSWAEIVNNLSPPVKARPIAQDHRRKMFAHLDYCN